MQWKSCSWRRSWLTNPLFRFLEGLHVLLPSGTKWGCGFIGLTVQKLQRERPLEVWSTSSSELGMFVKRNVLRGRRRRRKLWRHMTGDRAESKSFNTVANLAVRTEEDGVSHFGAEPHPTAHLRYFFLC